MVLDADLRNDTVPPHLRISATSPRVIGQSEEVSMLQRYMTALGQQYGQSPTYHIGTKLRQNFLVLLLMHRSYSCRAAFETPSNPLKHRFGPSVLASYKCAVAIADIMANLLERNPVWARQLIPAYSIAFCAATTLGSLVIFAPQWGHATKILMELDKVCRFFETTEIASLRKLLVSKL